MRSFPARSFIQMTMPGAYGTLIAVIIIMALLIYASTQYNHSLAIKNIKRNGIILVAIGVLMIAAGYAATLNALKYTHGSEKVTAQITEEEIEYAYSSEDTNDYYYTIVFPYKGEEISVRMEASYGLRFQQEDYIDVYFYPEEPGSDEVPVVVAVDIEVDMTKKYIEIGCLPCIAGIFLLFLAKAKEKLFSEGFHTSAHVTQISANRSESGNVKNGLILCQGKNPGTGMLQTFKSRGRYNDFGLLNEGDIVHVFIHKDNHKFYVINF